jgi:hypothetical protein
MLQMVYSPGSANVVGLSSDHINEVDDMMQKVVAVKNRIKSLKVG